MSTDIIERSADAGEPIDLYRFQYGTGTATRFTYCDADVPVTFDTAIYEPLTIERDPIHASGSLDRAELDVVVPQDSAIAQVFMAYPPSDVVALTIFRCHMTDAGITGPMAIWVGRVLAGNPEGYMSRLRCEPFTTSMGRVGLRRHWQYMCPHVLYGSACGVNRADHSILTSASGADARSITVPQLLEEQYLGGLVSWNPVGQPVERRTILHIDRNEQLGTSRLTVAGLVRDVSPGDPVELARGCRHVIADCRQVFANAPNFGGQPYIPGDNPHGSTRIYN